MKVVLYSTPTCPHCNNAKTYLTERGIAFEDYDVSKDEEKAREMIKKTGKGTVPVMDIEGTIIVGFDPKRIERALAGPVMKLDRDSVMSNLIFSPFD